MTEAYTVGDDTWQSAKWPNRAGQTFRPRVTHTLHYVDLLVRTTVLPTDRDIEIYHVGDDHKPTGDPISDAYGYQPLGLWPWDAERLRFVMRPVTLNKDWYYAIVAHGDPNLILGTLQWKYDAGDAQYLRGHRVSSNDGGVTWTVHFGDDHIFAEFGEPISPHVAVTPPMKNFIPTDLTHTPYPNGDLITLTTNVPCHLTCYWTISKPLKHRVTREVRGITVPWYTYFCFAGWQALEQQEDGDTLIHTFNMTPWPSCETRWYTFRGEVDADLSPSVGPIFSAHLSVASAVFNLQVAHNNDDCLKYKNLFWSCPAPCPSVLAVGTNINIIDRLGSGLRFMNFPVPPLSIIHHAYMGLTAATTATQVVIRSRLSAELDPNPPGFAYDDAGSFFTRYLNASTKVNYDNIPPWTIDNRYDTPDIKDPLQAVVNLPGWVTGNPVVIFWEDFDKRTDNALWHHRHAYPYNVSPSKAAFIYGVYEYGIIKEVL